MTLYKVCKICVNLLPVKTLLPGRVTWGSVGGVPLSQLPCGPANREQLITLKHHPQPSSAGRCGGYDQGDIAVWSVNHLNIAATTTNYTAWLWLTTLNHHHHHHLQPKLWRLRPTTRPRKDTYLQAVAQSSPARLVDVLILFGFFERLLSDPAGAFSLFVRSLTDIPNIW